MNAAGGSGSGARSAPRPSPARRIERAALAVACNPLCSTAGYWIATGAGAAWGVVVGSGPIGGRVRRRGELLVADTLPSWAFGRGGTTVGGVFLTSRAQTALMAESIYRHEAVHRAQWRRFGLWMIPLYLAAGRDPLRNRFEIEAGLAEGGYIRPPVVSAPPLEEFDGAEPPAPVYRDHVPPTSPA